MGRTKRHVYSKDHHSYCGRNAVFFQLIFSEPPCIPTAAVFATAASKVTAEVETKPFGHRLLSHSLMI